MKLTINVDQLACLRAGVDAPSSTVVLEMDPATLTQPERDLLARRLLDGHRVTAWEICPPTVEGLRATLGAILHRDAKQAEAEKAAREGRIGEALAAPLADWIECGSGGPGYYVSQQDDPGSYRVGSSGYFLGRPAIRKYPAGAYLDDLSLTDSRIIERRAQAGREWLPLSISEWDRHMAEYAVFCAQAERKAQERKLEAAAKAQRREEQIATWLATDASEGMRKRHERGLLPEEDILAVMADGVFGPLEELGRYVPITASEVRDDLEAEEDDKVTIFQSDAESATDDDVAMMERIEAALPGCSVKLVRHIGYLNDMDDADDPEVVRHAIHVTVTDGELTFKRRYQAGS